MNVIVIVMYLNKAVMEVETNEAGADATALVRDRLLHDLPDDALRVRARVIGVAAVVVVQVKPCSRGRSRLVRTCSYRGLAGAIRTADRDGH